MDILIKYHYDWEEIGGVKACAFGDWIDLRAVENYHLYKGTFELINLGVSMKLPENYEAHLAPRSSTFARYGIIQTNGVGIIDSSYCGDNDVWMMPVYATRETRIRKGDRICQFRIVEKQPNVNLRPVYLLDNADRGGFGSTGRD